jgi:hypothetical protein
MVLNAVGKCDADEGQACANADLGQAFAGNFGSRQGVVNTEENGDQLETEEQAILVTTVGMNKRLAWSFLSGLKCR